MCPRLKSRCAAKVHYCRSHQHLWTALRTWHARCTRGCSTRCKRLQVHRNRIVPSTFGGLFSEIDLGSPKLGKTYTERNAKLCVVIQKIADGLAEFPPA